MMNPFGITQGRLSPATHGRIQSFPVHTWQQEFTLAHQAGLDYIEWVYQRETEAENPLSADAALDEIHAVMQESGVTVWSITADYYMTHRLITDAGSPDEANLAHLKKLLGRAEAIGARYVMLPFVDGGRLHSQTQVHGLVTLLRSLAPVLDNLDIAVYMETDLKPARWAAVLQQVSHDRVGVCFDTGDRTSLGYDPAKDFKLLAHWLGSVHIKDRPVGGTSVALGTGAVDWPTCVKLIDDAMYTGPFILQTARDERISELELAVTNRRFVEELFQQAEN